MHAKHYTTVPALLWTKYSSMSRNIWFRNVHISLLIKSTLWSWSIKLANSMHVYTCIILCLKCLLSFVSNTKEINIKTVFWAWDRQNILSLIKIYILAIFWYIFLILITMSHRCAQSVIVNRVESHDWGFVIHEVNEGLKFVNKVHLL